MFPDESSWHRTGESLNEVPSTGQPWPEFKERFARLREAVNLIRTLWRGERVTFEGEYYKTEKATIYDRPDVEVPIYVAAAGALVAKYAGRQGDGFICTSARSASSTTGTLLPKVDRRHRLWRRAQQTLQHMIEVKGVVDTDRRRAAGHTALGGVALTPRRRCRSRIP